jgi:hypothetical protein
MLSEFGALTYNAKPSEDKVDYVINGFQHQRDLAREAVPRSQDLPNVGNGICRSEE